MTFFRDHYSAALKKTQFVNADLELKSLPILGLKQIA